MNSRGFTLIELTIVLIVFSILFSAAVATFGGSSDCRDAPRWKQKAVRAAAIADLGEINLKVEMFELNHRRNPVSLAEIGMHNKRDPWGNLYVYLDFAGLDGNGQKRKYRSEVPVNSYFDAYSTGPDGETSTPFMSALGEDDIVIANNGRYIGTACKYGDQ